MRLLPGRRAKSAKLNSNAEAAPSTSNFRLDYGLLYPCPCGPAWTMDDACGSLQIFGAPGSGKSSSIGKHLAMYMLGSGFGGLVMCAKADEAEVWKRYAVATGRENDLEIFNLASGHSFDLLQYELTRSSKGGGSTEEMAALLVKAMQAANDPSAMQSGDDNSTYFRHQMETLVRNTLDLCKLVPDDMSLELIDQVIRDAPYKADELNDPSIVERRVTHQLIWKWKAKDGIPDHLSEIERRDIERAVDFFEHDFPRRPDRTRESITSTFSGPVDRLLRGEYRELLSSGRVTIPPELSLEGKIIVLDFPVINQPVTGQMIQRIYKSIWQSAIRRRRVGSHEEARGVFLWADESQFFAHRDDVEFLSVARESRAVSVYLTQSIANYNSFLRPEDTRAILSNIRSQVCLSTGDPETRQHFIDLIGGRITYQVSSGESQDRNKDSTSNRNISQSVESQLKPEDFDQLRTGGLNNNRMVDMIFYEAGKVWPPKNQNYTTATYQQF